jgi:hypothetical protein
VSAHLSGRYKKSRQFFTLATVQADTNIIFLIAAIRITVVAVEQPEESVWLMHLQVCIWAENVVSKTMHIIKPND